MTYKIRPPKKKDTGISNLPTASEGIRERMQISPKWIALGTGVLGAFIIISLGLGFINDRSEEKAKALELKAADFFHAASDTKDAKAIGQDTSFSKEQLKKSVKLYEEITERFPKTTVAPIALFKAGNIHIQMKEYDLAEKYYTALLSAPTNAGKMIPLVHLKMGYLKRLQGNATSAIDHFRKAYEMEGTSTKDYAGFETARSLEQADRKQEATEVYRKISEEFIQSPWGLEAKARLLLLAGPVSPTQ